MHNKVYCSADFVKVTKLRRKGWTGHVVCSGVVRNSRMVYRSEKMSGRESSTRIIDHSSMEDSSWEVQS
jgi:hypothetical protein